MVRLSCKATTFMTQKLPRLKDFLWLQVVFCQKHSILILASMNSKYDDRLFVELRVEYCTGSFLVMNSTFMSMQKWVLLTNNNLYPIGTFILSLSKNQKWIETLSAYWLKCKGQKFFPAFFEKVCSLLSMNKHIFFVLAVIHW